MMILVPTHSPVLCLLVVVVVAMTCLLGQEFAVVEGRKFGLPFVSSSSSSKLSKTKKGSYTPLVFFTYPKGSIAECDEMEKVVSEVERELGVRVERMDVARDAAAKAAMSLLTSQTGPPFLYHRESCQVVHASTYRTNAFAKPKAADGNSNDDGEIDKSRIVAWAKGRYLPPPGMNLSATTSGVKSGAPVVVSQEDDSLDQAELIKESSLTPEQLEGKRAMEERTEK